jgi:hypothetical protein
MGDKCPNCPLAVAIGDTLISPTANRSYVNHIVLMEEDMGTFALTGSDGNYPSYAFNTDYTSVAGNNWLKNLFNISLWPGGYINREGRINPSSYLPNISYTTWQDTVQNILGRSTPSVEIQIQDSCWVPDRKIGVKFQVTFLQTPPAGDYYLEPVIVEDHIISWQIDDLVALQYDSAYDHRFVLRGSFDLNGSGALIPSASVAKGSTWTSYQTYDFTKGENGKAGGINGSKPWNMANCYVVAFVYNSATQQVYQADMVKIEP